MDDFDVKGVVLNGRVVLDESLSVPDGTLVTVRRYEEDDRDETTGVPLRERVRQLYAMVDVIQIQIRAIQKTIKSEAGREAA